jgi:hypothetical protein
MAIQLRKKPQAPAAVPAGDALDQFIAGAPDAAPAAPQKKIKRAGRKAIITLSMDPELLAKLDAWAASRGLSRAAAVSFAVGNLDGMSL